MSMEYMGHTQTANYMTGPRLGTRSNTFLPDIAEMLARREQNSTGRFSYGSPAPAPTQLNHSMHTVTNVQPAPSPLRRSMTAVDWKPGVYYQTAKVNPSSAVARSMPEPLNHSNYLTRFDTTKTPSIFGSARNALYTRYTPDQWKASNSSNYMLSDTVRGAGERMRLDAVKLCQQADERVKRAQLEASKRLGQRINDIQFWKDELRDETNRMVDDINYQAEKKRILEKSLAESENPLKVAQECLYNREKRQGIDLVHDEPEMELIKEVDAIKECQERMRELCARSNTQLSANRAALHELERDTDDKHSALNIDSACHKLKNTSNAINFHNGVERVDNTKSVPETWAKFTADNIDRSAAERSASTQLRDTIDEQLDNCINDMWAHFNRVNQALTRRTQETTEARNRIQSHLSKVMQEVFDVEKHIELLKKAIYDKENPLKVAQTRLRTRGHRPNVEGCRDAAQHRLVEEVQEIYETVEQLQAKLRDAENALQHLLTSKNSLEHDLAIKNNSLFIDQEKCLAIRKQFPMTPRVAMHAS